MRKLYEILFLGGGSSNLPSQSLKSINMQLLLKLKLNSAPFKKVMWLFKFILFFMDYLLKQFYRQHVVDTSSLIHRLRLRVLSHCLCKSGEECKNPAKVRN